MQARGSAPVFWEERGSAVKARTPWPRRHNTSFPVRDRQTTDLPTDQPRQPANHLPADYVPHLPVQKNPDPKLTRSAALCLPALTIRPHSLACNNVCCTRLSHTGEPQAEADSTGFAHPHYYASRHPRGHVPDRVPHLPVA